MFSESEINDDKSLFQTFNADIPRATLFHIEEYDYIYRIFHIYWSFNDINSKFLPK
jgi:hypothetical protein